VAELHVVPRGDLIEHRVEHDGECVCGPRPEPSVNDDGRVDWVTVHHSLDGRERTEQES